MPQPEQVLGGLAVPDTEVGAALDSRRVDDDGREPPGERGFDGAVSVGKGIDDEPKCTQCSRPSTRNPVSSNPATSAAAMVSRTCARKPSSLPAARAVMPATVPDDSAMPNSSASACAVRSVDRNCPAYRYTMIAATRGPYCTGASPPRGAAALVRCPHPHSRSIS